MFPDFNIHSGPLLSLVLQGLIFAALLGWRFLKERKHPDLLMVLIIVSMAYHRGAYTLGFMGWYDTFQNTKVNYFLFSIGLATGPLIYLYVKALLQSPFRIQKTDLWHFLPAFTIVIYHLILMLHDATRPGWESGYEGEWLRDFDVPYIQPITRFLEYSSLLLYLAFTIQLFARYRIRIKSYFSNTHQIEMNWIQVFLIVYIFLFAYETITDLVDALIIELSYSHKWWVHFAYALAIIFFGMKAYFTNVGHLATFTFQSADATSEARNFNLEKERVKLFVETNQSYLKPDFTLKSLSEGVNMSMHDVSATINNGYRMNFNEWINRYRVEEVKKRLLDPSKKHYSLVALAFESGFNSKASFNRIFKRVEGVSPSEFKLNQKR